MLGRRLPSFGGAGDFVILSLPFLEAMEIF
jgi:hypothetical protein